MFTKSWRSLNELLWWSNEVFVCQFLKKSPNVVFLYEYFVSFTWNELFFTINGNNNYFPTFSNSTMYDLTKPFPDLLGFLRQLKSPPKFRANIVNTWTKQKMAGFDEGGVFFSDNFASEEQTDENQINRQQVKKRLKDFIRQFHEGNFSYTYRYKFFFQVCINFAVISAFCVVFNQTIDANA